MSEASGVALTAREPKAAATPPENLLKTHAVLNRLGGISSQTLWRFVKDPKLEFPAPIHKFPAIGCAGVKWTRLEEKGAPPPSAEIFPL